MIFDKNAEKMTTPQVNEETLQVNEDTSPRKLTAIEKKLKKFDNEIQQNLEDYTSGKISDVVHKLRREKIIKRRNKKQEDLEQQ